MCKDIFSLGIDDIKPEVQLLAVAGMVAYLATYKTVTELGAIAAVYTKNSDILAARCVFMFVLLTISDLAFLLICICHVIPDIYFLRTQPNITFTTERRSLRRRTRPKAAPPSRARWTPSTRTPS